MKQVNIDLGGVIIRCELKFDDAADYFNGYIVPGESGPGSCRTENAGAEGEAAIPTAAVTDMDWDFWREYHAVIDPHLEFSSLTGSCSDALLKYGRAAFHAVSFLHGGKAWLIAAPSGVGKTTQLMNLCSLWPGEFSIISGDRPILELKDDGTVYVHTSPWNGKEELAGKAGGVLAGIICLKRGEQNSIRTLTAKGAGFSVYLSVIQTAESEEGIKRAAAFATELLKRVPAWELTSNTVPDSTKLLYEEVLK